MSLFIIRTKLDSSQLWCVKVSSQVSNSIGSHERVTAVHSITDNPDIAYLVSRGIQHGNEPRLVTCQESESNHCRRIMGLCIPTGPSECSLIFPGMGCLIRFWLSNNSMTENAHSFFFFSRISSWQRRQKHEFLCSIEWPCPWTPFHFSLPNTFTEPHQRYFNYIWFLLLLFLLWSRPLVSETFSSLTVFVSF